MDGGAAAALEQALLDATGVQASVLLVPADDLAAIAAANPLRDITTDASRGFVTFLSRPLDPALVPAPDADVLAPEVLVVAERAIYQWCPDGVARRRRCRPRGGGSWTRWSPRGTGAPCSGSSSWCAPTP